MKPTKVLLFPRESINPKSPDYDCIAILEDGTQWKSPMWQETDRDGKPYWKAQKWEPKTATKDSPAPEPEPEPDEPTQDPLFDDIDF
jgi:hypothetical protein